MKKTLKNKKGDVSERIEQLKIEASILRGAYFQLEKSEKNYQNLVENSIVGIARTNLKGKFIFVNNRLCEIVGYSRKELIGESFDKFLHPDEKKKILKLFWKAFVAKKKQINYFEFQAVNKKGRSIYMSASPSVNTYRGKVISFNAVLQDITGRKKAEKELQGSEERLSFLVSSGPAVIYVSKAYGDYAATFISGNIKEQMGYKPESFIEDPAFWVNHIHPDDRQRILKELSEIFKKGHHSHEYRFKHKNGFYKWMRDEARLIKDESGKPKEIIGYWADVTERKKAEEEKLKALYGLRERMKELTCLYQIDEITRRKGVATEKIFQETVKIIPLSWQYPKVTCACIIFEGKEYKSKNFKNTKWCQQSDIIISNKKVGLIKVCYLEKKPDEYEGPFFKEERALIDSIAQRLGEEIRRKEAEGALLESEQRLREAQRVARVGSWDWNIEANKLLWSNEIYRIFGLKPQQFGATYEAFLRSVHPDDRNLVKESIDAALLKKKPYSIDHRVVLPDGKERIVHEEAKIFFNSSGKPIRMLGTVHDVTERKKAEQRIRSSEERLKILFESAPDAYFLTDLKDNFVDVNETAEKLTGYKKKEIIGKSFLTLELLPKEQIVKALSGLKEVILGKPVGVREYILNQKNGGRVDVEIKAHLVKIGSDLLVLSTARDISDRKGAEKVLKKSEARFRNIFDGARDALIYFDKFGKIININKAAIEMFGEKREELIGKHFAKAGILSLKDIPRMAQAFTRTITGKKSDLEVHIKNKQGKEIDLETSSTILKIGGEVLGVMVVARDVTKRKAIEKELAKHRESLEKKVKKRTRQLEEAKNQSEALLASIGDGVFAINTERNIIHFNRRAEELSGYKSSEVLGKPYYDFLKFIKEKDKSENVAFIRKAFKGEIAGMIEETALIRKDGSELPVEDSAAPIRDEKRKIVGIIVVFRDASKERKIQQIQSEFTSLASHEMRTPLGIIKGYLSELIDEKVNPLTEKQQELVRVAMSASDKVLKQAEELLEISRLEEGRVKIEPLIVDPIDLAKKTIGEEILQLFKQKKQKFIFKKPKDLPKIKVDPRFVMTPIKNLLSNASKYTPEEGIIELKISQSQGKKEIIFQVTDSGIGIPRQEQPRVFQRFFRASNTTRLEKGTGLGLYMSKLMIETLRGKIWFESEEGKGTTFYFSLPVSRR